MLYLLDGTEFDFCSLIHAAIACESLISDITNFTNGTPMIVQVFYKPKIEYTLPKT